MPVQCCHHHTTPHHNTRQHRHISTHPQTIQFTSGSSSHLLIKHSVPPAVQHILSSALDTWQRNWQSARVSLYVHSVLSHSASLAGDLPPLSLSGDTFLSHSQMHSVHTRAINNAITFERTGNRSVIGDCFTFPRIVSASWLPADKAPGCLRAVPSNTDKQGRLQYGSLYNCTAFKWQATLNCCLFFCLRYLALVLLCLALNLQLWLLCN